MRKLVFGLAAVAGLSSFAPTADASWFTHLFHQNRQPVYVVNENCAPPPVVVHHHGHGQPVYYNQPQVYRQAPNYGQYNGQYNSGYNGGGYRW